MLSCLRPLCIFNPLLDTPLKLQILHESSSELPFEDGKEVIDITDAVTGFEETCMETVLGSQLFKITERDGEMGAVAVIGEALAAGAAASAWAA